MTDPRRSVITMRVTPQQKKRIQRKAKKAGETVSTYLLRAVESAGEIPPRQSKGKGEDKSIRIVISDTPVKQSNRPEITGDGTVFVLDERAKRLAE